jgi:hypothetical protein
MPSEARRRMEESSGEGSILCGVIIEVRCRGQNKPEGERVFPPSPPWEKNGPARWLQYPGLPLEITIAVQTMRAGNCNG